MMDWVIGSRRWLAGWLAAGVMTLGGCVTVHTEDHVHVDHVILKVYVYRVGEVSWFCEDRGEGEGERKGGCWRLAQWRDGE